MKGNEFVSCFRGSEENFVFDYVINGISLISLVTQNVTQMIICILYEKDEFKFGDSEEEVKKVSFCFSCKGNEFIEFSFSEELKKICV